MCKRSGFNGKVIHAVVYSLGVVAVIFSVWCQSVAPVSGGWSNATLVRTAPTSEHICHPRLPDADCDAAAMVYEFVITHNWSPPRGYAGGKKFEDKMNKLPPGGDYLEYDIYPIPPPGAGGRDAKRLVFNRSNQECYYTDDHFVTFTVFQYS